MFITAHLACGKVNHPEARNIIKIQATQQVDAKTQTLQQEWPLLPADQKVVGNYV